MSQNCPLLTLPAELRVTIYEIITASSPDAPIYVHRVSEDHPVGNFAALARVSRQIRREYLATHHPHAHIALKLEDVAHWFRSVLRSMLPTDAAKCVLHLQILITQVYTTAEQPTDILPILRYKELLRRYALRYPSSAGAPSCKFVLGGPRHIDHKSKVNPFAGHMVEQTRRMIERLNRISAIQDGMWLRFLGEGSPLARVVLRMQEGRVTLVLRSRKGVHDRQFLSGYGLKVGDVDGTSVLLVDVQTTRSMRDESSSWVLLGRG